MKTIAYVALGANLGDREAAFARALERLGQFEGVRVLRCSPLYETDPVGMPEGSPPFLNAVAEIETELPARRLLEVMMQVEREAGRERVGHTPASRTLDLDLLVFGDTLIDEPGLQVPHPRAWARRFALGPLADLAPNMRLPGDGRTIREILLELEDSARCERAARQPAWINP